MAGKCSREKRSQAGRLALSGWYLEQPWGQMRVWQVGRGPIVIALHGLGGSGRYWQRLAQPDCFTLIAPDLGGFGQSSKPNLTFDRDFHLASLDRLIDNVAPAKPVSLVGHSLGGVLAALWAARHPERLSSLALIATPFPGVHSLPPPVRWVKDNPQSLARRLPISLVRLAAYPIVLPLGLFRGYGLAAIGDFARQSVVARAWTGWSLMVDQTTADKLKPLKQLPPPVATLLLTGQRDRLSAPRDRAAWSALLPAADHLSTDGGHQLLLNGGFSILSQWLNNRFGPHPESRARLPGPASTGS
jgi:pimeloyl-ACP methyl ester carboxylesterase